MSNIAIIPARGGSKGIPNKNIISLGGRPLIEYSIEVALQSSNIDHIIVSSDSKKILSVAKKFSEKIIPILRPSALASDTSATESVIAHAIDHLTNAGITIDYIVLLQPTSPFRKAEFINESISLIRSSQADCLISISQPIQHPSDFIFNDKGSVKYICRDEHTFRRQDFKAAQFINGSIYITKHDFFVRTGKIYSLDTCLLYEMPVEYSVDIDTPFDLMICEAVMRNAKGD